MTTITVITADNATGMCEGNKERNKQTKSSALI